MPESNDGGVYERMSAEALHVDLARSLATSAMRDALRDFDEFAQLVHQNLRHQGTPNARSLGRVLATWLKRLRELVDALPAAIAERPVNEGPIVGTESTSSVAPPASDNAPAVRQGTPRDERSGPITSGDAPRATTPVRGLDAPFLSVEQSRELEHGAELLAGAGGMPEEERRIRFLLARAANRARLLEELGDLMDEYEREHSRAKAYENFGIRSFPAGDALARHDVPALVAEVKRLRGWS